MLSDSNELSPSIPISDTDSKCHSCHPCFADGETNRGSERLDYLSEAASKKPKQGVCALVLSARPCLLRGARALCRTLRPKPRFPCRQNGNKTATATARLRREPLEVVELEHVA